eukprot:TRINITY_DN8009_c0_g1_i1.p1 TRINITY_DN8009_c0_g1~~TRINITY_DN8009_c0_g1_i1.p1  ORF type:complete len:704 (+),score=124.98 TRINITY_DN8009_c0_g1_i1:94-2112(+)
MLPAAAALLAAGGPAAAVPYGHMYHPSPGQRRRPRVAAARHLVLNAFDVDTSVRARFATSVSTAAVANTGEQALTAEATFELPSESYISAFTIEQDGVVYKATVREREEAARLYREAAARNQTAAQVVDSSPSTPGREMSHFTVPVSVAPRKTAVLRLTHVMLLRRRQGLFTLDVPVSPFLPLAPDRNATATVLVHEPQGLTTNTVLESKAVGYVEDRLTITETSRRWSVNAGRGAALVLKYDVSRADDGGRLMHRCGHFVHFFSPAVRTGAGPLGKAVVFAIDSSGSMAGRKISQARAALRAIVSQLRSRDAFSILTFSSDLTWMHEEMRPVTADSIESAHAWIRNIEAGGGTNINDAVVGAKRLAGAYAATDRHLVPMVVFLSDGMPNSGVTSPGAIRANVRSVPGGACVWSLSFGMHLDWDLMRALAYENCGEPRRIYAEDDAAEQLENFFAEIQTPLLGNVRFSYDSEVRALSSRSAVDPTAPATFFEGTELVLAGRAGATTLSGRVTADAASGGYERDAVALVAVDLPYPRTMSPTGARDAATDTPEAHVSAPIDEDDYDYPGQCAEERMWAFLRVKQLLRRVLVTRDQSSRDNATAEALRVSLKYQLVTPLTSLFVAVPGTGPGDHGTAMEYDGGYQHKLQSPAAAVRPLLASAITVTGLAVAVAM